MTTDSPLARAAVKGHAASGVPDFGVGKAFGDQIDVCQRRHTGHCGDMGRDFCGLDPAEQIVDQRLAWSRFKVSYDGMEKGVVLPRAQWIPAHEWSEEPSA